MEWRKTFQIQYPIQTPEQSYFANRSIECKECPTLDDFNIQLTFCLIHVFFSWILCASVCVLLRVFILHNFIDWMSVCVYGRSWGGVLWKRNCQLIHTFIDRFFTIYVAVFAMATKKFRFDITVLLNTWTLYFCWRYFHKLIPNLNCSRSFSLSIYWMSRYLQFYYYSLSFYHTVLLYPFYLFFLP